MTVRHFLDLSTAHLSPATRDLLDDARGPSTRYPHPEGYGWFVYVAEEEDSEDVPADLLGCLKRSRALACDYILFDCDGPIDCDLPVYADAEGETSDAEVRQRERFALFEMQIAPDGG